MVARTNDYQKALSLHLSAQKVAPSTWAKFVNELPDELLPKNDREMRTLAIVAVGKKKYDSAVRQGLLAGLEAFGTVHSEPSLNATEQEALEKQQHVEASPSHPGFKQQGQPLTVDSTNPAFISNNAAGKENVADLGQRQEKKLTLTPSFDLKRRQALELLKKLAPRPTGGRKPRKRNDLTARPY